MTAKRGLSITLIMVMCILSFSSPVVADDERASCWEDPSLTELNGEVAISGEKDTPDDEDGIRFELEKGDYVSMKLKISPDADSYGVWIGEDNPEFSVNSVKNADTDPWGGGGLNIYPEYGTEATWKFWAEEGGVYCIEMSDFNAGDAAGVDWRMTMIKNEDFSTPTPTPTATPTPAPTATPTPAPTATPTPTPTPTPTATPTPTSESSGPASTRTPGTNDSEDDIQDTDGDGVIDSEDYAPRDPDVQEESDLQSTSGASGPGFGVGATLITLLLGTLFVLRRS